MGRSCGCMTEIFRHYVGIAEALIGRIAKKNTNKKDGINIL